MRANSPPGTSAGGARRPRPRFSPICACCWRACWPICEARLRATRPELPRPFRSPLYPLAPLGYLAVGLLILGSSLWDADARTIGIGLAVLATGSLAFLFWRPRTA